MIRKLVPTLALFGALATAPLAFAQTPIDPQRPTAVSMDQARRIAADNGMIRVVDIELKDGAWQMEGHDSIGAEVKMILRANDGTVVKNERERPALASARP